MLHGWKIGFIDGVKVTRQSVGSSDQNMFEVCMVDFVSSNCSVQKLGSPQVSHIHE